MELSLSESLSTLVERKYQIAKAAESLIFSRTDLALIRIAGLPVRT